MRVVTFIKKDYTESFYVSLKCSERLSIKNRDEDKRVPGINLITDLFYSTFALISPIRSVLS